MWDLGPGLIWAIQLHRRVMCEQNHVQHVQPSVLLLHIFTTSCLSAAFIFPRGDGGRSEMWAWRLARSPNTCQVKIKQETHLYFKIWNAFWNVRCVWLHRSWDDGCLERRSRGWELLYCCILQNTSRGGGHRKYMVSDNMGSSCNIWMRLKYHSDGDTKAGPVI